MHQVAINFSSKMKIKLPNLDFTRTFEEIAERIIRPDMRLGINRGIGIDNQPFPPLEPSTIAAKTGARKKARKSGGLKKAGLASGGTQTLVDTGLLRESIDQTTIGRNHVKIFIDGQRAQVGYYLQKTGVGKKRKTFNFFGISQRAELQAIAKMNLALKQALAEVNNG